MMIQIKPPDPKRPASRHLETLQVGVLVEIDDTWGRNVVEAIARSASDYGWQLLIAPRDDERRLRIPNGWRGDGIIASVRDHTLLKHIEDQQLPAINVSGMFADQGWIGHVSTDDQSRAEMAFSHFATRQLRSFACYYPKIGRYSGQRAKAFAKVVRDAGFPCEMLTDIEYDNSSHSQRENICQRIKELPKPVGVFAADPYSARQLVEACQAHEILVPGEVLVLSGDEDELLCSLISPTISSIELASHRIGFEASKMLNSIMQTGVVPCESVQVKPLRVCPRRSTDAASIGNPCMEAVLSYMESTEPGQLEIRDLVSIAAMSRRSLEMLFRETIGRSPAAEIRRVRLDKARQMLLGTSLSVSSIAQACGFSSGPYLTHAFRKHYGTVPSKLRIGRK